MLRNFVTLSNLRIVFSFSLLLTERVIFINHYTRRSLFKQTYERGNNNKSYMVGGGVKRIKHSNQNYFNTRKSFSNTCVICLTVIYCIK